MDWNTVDVERLADFRICKEEAFEPGMQNKGMNHVARS